MKISINQLRLELADILEGHLQMNTFFWGDFPRAVNEENINYPLMAGYYPSAGLLDNQTTLPITIVIADKIYEDYTNLNDVESDTLQYCRDVFNIMNKSARWQKLGRVESCSLTKFIEGNADVCAGHIMTVNFTLRDSNSICDLPMAGYDFDQVIGASCLPVQIYRNGVLVDTVASGGTYSYTTDAFTYTIKNTALTTLYSGNVTANLSVTIQDATVENSDASYSTSIVAEGSLVLPDITVDVTNSALTVVNTATVASVQDVTISAPDGTVNIKKTGDGTIHSESVPSGATVDYSVADNAITVNSTNGFSIDATDPLDIVLTDGTSSVIPTSVTYTQAQHKVDIVLPTSGTPIDADAQAFLTATGITDSTITSAINDMVVCLKTSSLWSKMHAIYPFVGGTASTHKFNLKDPRDLDAAFRLVFSGGWTHNASGATPNGTNGYANTFLIESAFMTTNSNGLGFYLGTNNSATSSDPVDMGTYISATQTSLIAAKNDYNARVNGSAVAAAQATRLGFYSAQRTSATLTTNYKNGLAVTSGNSGGTLPNIPLYIGNISFTTNTPYSNGYTNNRFQFAFVSDGLSQAENIYLQTIVHLFQVKLSRNV